MDRFYRVIVLIAMHVSVLTEECAARNELPRETSIYNRGLVVTRYRDANGQIMRFALKSVSTSLYDGSGRRIGEVRGELELHDGTWKKMQVEDNSRSNVYYWAWRTNAGSGWIARESLANPPPATEKDMVRYSRPAPQCGNPLVIDAAAGRKKLNNLRHAKGNGKLPTKGGNKGEYYGGRNPGAKDYVYLLSAAPNVKGGGLAQDSLPDGSKFIPGIDENAKPIVEVVRMYRDGDRSQPVDVTFLYGRSDKSDIWGWLARANVGDL